MAVDVTITGTNLTKKNAKPRLDGADASWKGTPSDTSGVVSVPTTAPKTVKVSVKNDEGESPTRDFTIAATGSATIEATPGPNP